MYSTRSVAVANTASWRAITLRGTPHAAIMIAARRAQSLSPGSERSTSVGVADGSRPRRCGRRYSTPIQASIATKITNNAPPTANGRNVPSTPMPMSMNSRPSEDVRRSGSRAAATAPVYPVTGSGWRPATSRATRSSIFSTSLTTRGAQVLHCSKSTAPRIVAIHAPTAESAPRS